jgi:hypothetical protein
MEEAIKDINKQKHKKNIKDPGHGFKKDEELENPPNSILEQKKEQYTMDCDRTVLDFDKEIGSLY